jgi:hypothetical protein
MVPLHSSTAVRSTDFDEHWRKDFPKLLLFNSGVSIRDKEFIPLMIIVGLFGVKLLANLLHISYTQQQDGMTGT